MPQFLFGLVPPASGGGFHFPQELPSGNIVQITAQTKDELDAKILTFRANNGLEIGDPARESNDYLCAKWPSYCRPDPITEADETPKGKTLQQRTTNWRYNRYSQAQKDYELAPEETAKERALICQSCPNNLDNKTGCTPCRAENDRILFSLRQGRETGVTGLGGCRVTGQDLETAAWLQGDMLNYANAYQDELPSFCWLKHGK